MQCCPPSPAHLSLCTTHRIQDPPPDYPRPCGHSRVPMETKSPHELQQGLAHGHSHLQQTRQWARVQVPAAPAAGPTKPNTPALSKGGGARRPGQPPRAGSSGAHHGVHGQIHQGP